MFKTETIIDSTRIAYLAVTAFECNDMTASWCDSAKPASPVPEGEDPWYFNPAFWDSDFQIDVCFDDPEADGRSRHVQIGRAEVQAGFDKMASDYPSHLGDIINDNYDAETADTWWQLVVLKDIIYG